MDTIIDQADLPRADCGRVGGDQGSRSRRILAHAVLALQLRERFALPDSDTVAPGRDPFPPRDKKH